MSVRIPLIPALAGAMLLTFTGEASATQQSYKYVALASLGGGQGGATAISNTGQISGYSYIDANVFHAVRWTGTSVSDLGAPSGFSSEGLAISRSGQVAGSIMDASNFPVQAASWTAKQLTPLAIPAGAGAKALGINDAGAVVGYSYDLDDSPRATIWNGTTTTLLSSLTDVRKSSTATDINNNGVVTGVSYFDKSSNRHAVVWNAGTITDLGTLGGNISYASGINDAGVVVGFATTSANMNFHATMWNNGIITDLGTGNMDYAMASDVNSAGQAVGYACTNDFRCRAMLWQHGEAIDLNTYLDATLASQGWELQAAGGINDQGQIVGSAINKYTQTSQAFLLTSSVPEADTASMLLAGLGLVAWLARRRKAA